VVDSRVRAFVHRGEQLAPAGTPPFTSAPQSQFLAGIELFVNKDGPGSIGLRAARFTGPALPPGGVVLTRPDPAIVTNQTWLSILRKDGRVDFASATPSQSSSNTFLWQRTAGLTGTVRPNPNEANPNNTQFPEWAHHGDYPGASGSDYIDFSLLKANIAYTLELFYDDSEAVPRHTYTKVMLSPVTPATHAMNLRWHALTAGTLGYLDPSGALAAEQTSATVTWTPDPFAESVSSVGFYTFSVAQSVSNALVIVPRGATSAAISPPEGATFQALTADGTSGRRVQLRHRMLDGSFKNSEWRYN
jgi:hypothetical protein